MPVQSPEVTRVSAPEEMDRPAPVMSVIRASEPTRRLSVTVVVALREFMILKVAIVEEACTKIPAVVEVGVRALVNRVSQAPGEPEPAVSSVPHSTVPLALVSKAVQVPYPSIARLVVVAPVWTHNDPLPTKPAGFSVPTTNREVLVAFPVILKVESNVEEALINNPAVVEVGVRALLKAKTRLCSVAVPV